MKNHALLRNVLATTIAALCTVAQPSRSLAGDGTWLGTSGAWSDGGIWSGGIVADGTDFTANFTGVNITVAQAVTLDDLGRTIGGITFTDATTSSHDLTISGANALTLDTTSPAVPAINVTQSGRTLTISSQVSGADGLLKSGAGNLTLAGTNDYTGGTFIAGGFLITTADANLGNAADGVTFTANGTLRLTGTINSAREITLSSGVTGSLQGGAGVTYTNSGRITGAGNLLFTQTGSGTRIFNLTNTGNDFTGSFGVDIAGSGQNITVNFASITDGVGDGNIRFGTGSVTPTLNYTGAAPLVLNNRRIEFFNNGNASGTLTSSVAPVHVNTDLLISGTGNKTLFLGSGAGITSTFNTGIANGSGTVALSKSGLGTWALSGTNTYSGATTVLAGGGRLIFQGLQSLSPSTTLTLSQNSSSTSAVSLLTDTPGVTTLPNNLNINHANAVLGINVFVGNNNVINGGTSAGTTTGATVAFNKLTFSGLNNSQGLVGIASITSADGYRLQFNSVELPAFNFTSLASWTARVTSDTAPVTINGTIQQLAGTSGFATRPIFSLAGTSTESIVAADILDPADYPANTSTAPLELTKVGNGTWTLTGTNTYTGSTTITAGVLKIDGASSLGGGNLRLDGGVLGLASGNFSRADGTGAGTYQFTTNGGGFAAYGADRSVTLGTQNWNTTGMNGILRLSAADADATVTLTSNLSFAGGTRTIQVADGSAAVDAVFSGALLGGGTFNKAGAGTLRLTSSSSSYTAATRIQGGVLEVLTLADGGEDSSLGASANAAANLLLDNGTTLRYIGTGDSTDRRFTINGTAGGNNAILDSSGSGPVEFTNPASPAYGTSNQGRFLQLTGTNTGENILAAGIANNGSGLVNVTKNGTGTWVLTGASTYGGVTTVNAGELLINGTLSGTGAVTVAAAGTLGGTGTIAGSATISGTLAPGTSIESLGLGGLSMTSGSTFAVEFDSSAPPATGADILLLGGSLSLSGTVSLTLSDLAAAPSGILPGTTLSIINYTGSWNGGFFSFGGNELADGEQFTAGLNTWEISYAAAEGGLNFSGQYAGGGDSFVNLTVVPEAGGTLLGALGALLLLMRRPARAGC